MPLQADDSCLSWRRDDVAEALQQAIRALPQGPTRKRLEVCARPPDCGTPRLPSPVL